MTTSTLQQGIAWRDYYELTKPKVVMLIVFTAIVGMFLATPGMVEWTILVFGTFGIWLSASSAAAINHLVDRRIDAIMARTRHRPLPTGQLKTGNVLIFAVVNPPTTWTMLPRRRSRPSEPPDSPALKFLSQIVPQTGLT